MYSIEKAKPKHVPEIGLKVDVAIHHELCGLVVPHEVIHLLQQSYVGWHTTIFEVNVLTTRMKPIFA